MIDITDPRDCCGCTACASICGKDAIKMTPDAMGFLYPVVDTDLCVECGMCEKVCAFNDNYDRSFNLASPDAYAVRHKDMRQVETSRSGGAFIAFSDYVLAQGGVVYGAGYTDHFRVVHKRAVTSGERDEFKGSKYVQSDLTGIFRQVRDDLKSGRKVMFSGTPCQTSGLASFIGPRLRDNLYLVDIVCHGVPGPYIWRDYLEYVEKRMGSPLVEVDFRDKKHFGWTAHRESFKTATRYKDSNAYTYLFYEHIMFRHSCEVCHFANLQRPSDVTLADFWGWKESVPGFNADDKGCSLVLCNTVKGQQLLDEVKGHLDFIPVNVEDCLQPNLRHPTTISPMRMKFERDYERHGLQYIMKHYGDSRFKRFRRRLLRKIRRIATLSHG